MNLTPHKRQLIADNEAKRKEMLANNRALWENGVHISYEVYLKIYHAITDKYNAIEKTIKENKENEFNTKTT